jgi:hypothetical protein
MYLNIGIDVARDVHEACILNEEGNLFNNYHLQNCNILNQ